jgi:hypothetical protein
MAMEPPVLTNPAEFPADAVIASHLGKRLALWNALFEFVSAAHPDCAAQWRYYRDGKSWLLNLSRKKKTVLWISVIRGAFRATAYFTDRARDAILASTLSDELKAQFLEKKPFGKLRGITITFTKKRDVEDAKVLIALKIAR